MWLNRQRDWANPEQLSLPPVPGQPPLSRWSAQKDSSAKCFALAQRFTAFASATVKVSEDPKSSMPIISVIPTLAHRSAADMCGWI